MTTTNESSIQAIYRVIREDGSHEEVEMPLYNTMDERLAMARTKVSGNIERVVYMRESRSSTTAHPPADGGPAFPVPELNWAHGISLRDHLASIADLAGIIENGGVIEERLAKAIMGGNPPDWDADYVAAHSWWFEAEARVRYLKADSMLKARG
ncbi:hypothetical protein [Burkholderia gladioli]